MIGNPFVKQLAVNVTALPKIEGFALGTMVSVVPKATCLNGIILEVRVMELNANVATALVNPTLLAAAVKEAVPLVGFPDCWLMMLTPLKT